MRKIFICIYGLVFLYYVIKGLLNPYDFQKSSDNLSNTGTTIESVNETLRYKTANQINDRCTWIQIHLDDFIYKEGDLYHDYIYGNHVVRRSFELRDENKESTSYLLYYDDSGDLINASISHDFGNVFAVYFPDGPVNGYYELVVEAIKGNEQFDFILDDVAICVEYAYK